MFNLAYPLREPEDLGVEYLDSFWDSFLLLDHSPGTFRALMELLWEASAHPEASPLFEDTRMRIMLTEPDSGLPPLRLYYFIENGAIHMTEVDVCDDFEL
jgi:hypothetical protein